MKPNKSQIPTGSVLVTKGEDVKRGQKLGEVGYSGFTQFPHLHLSVRHNGKVIDPFTGQTPDKTCHTDVYPHETTLWTHDVLKDFPYKQGQIMQTGFADRAVSTSDLEKAKIGLLTTKSPALVFFARIINLDRADQLAITISGPEGLISRNKTKPLERHKAQYLIYTGEKRRADRWPAGEYKGQIEIIRNNTTVEMREQTISLN